MRFIILIWDRKISLYLQLSFTISFSDYLRCRGTVISLEMRSFCNSGRAGINSPLVRANLVLMLFDTTGRFYCSSWMLV